MNTTITDVLLDVLGVAITLIVVAFVGSLALCAADLALTGVASGRCSLLFHDIQIP